MKYNFKLTCMFPLLGILFFNSCQIDDRNDHEHDHGHHYGVIEKIISLEEFQTMPGAKESLDKIIAAGAVSTERSVYNNKFDFFVDTSQILKIENGDYHSLTFPIYRLENDPKYLENLVLILQDDRSYMAAIYKYELTPRNREELLAGIPTIPAYRSRTILQGFDSGSLTNRTVQVFYTDFIVIPCSSGEHHAGNMESWGGCKVTPAQLLIVTRSVLIDIRDAPAPVDTEMGSGIGGGGGPAPYNPNVPPLDPANIGLVKGNLTRPLLRPNAEQNFFNSLSNDQRRVMQEQESVRNKLLQFLSHHPGRSPQHYDTVADNLAKNILTLAITNNGAAIQILNYMEAESYSEEALELAMKAVEDIVNGEVPDNIVNLINDPWVANLVSNTYTACASTGSNLNDVFLNIFAGSDTHNVLYTSSTTLPNSTAGRTIPLSQTIGNNGYTVYNFEISLRESYVNTATDLSIATTVIHENIHAILLYLKYSNVIYTFDNNPTYQELLTKYVDHLITIGYQPYMPMPANGNLHHDFMAKLVKDIAIAIKAYGMSMGYNLPDDFYNAMAWSGLTNTPTFQSLYPQYLQNGAINPAWVKIVNTLATEQDNISYNDANGNPITVKGNSHP